MKVFSAPNLLLVAITALALSGCGSGPSPDAQKDGDRLKLVQTYRAYYNQAKGDYASLPEPDKAAFIKLAGDDTKAQTVWNQMKYGPTGKPGS